MSLRDAIREMVRWCQAKGLISPRIPILASVRMRESCKATHDRDEFRRVIVNAAGSIRHAAWACEAMDSRAVAAAWQVTQAWLDDDPAWRVATRSVWATL